MEKVRPWCGQPSNEGWLINRAELKEQLLHSCRNVINTDKEKWTQISQTMAMQAVLNTDKYATNHVNRTVQ